ncbi:hypothetical protein C8R45DRAFT_1204281 [Mycena sanguinolenta]|nr:hypothetical protein C8R45DRAFT_1204281 [Mycena sanguinolenta]
MFSISPSAPDPTENEPGITRSIDRWFNDGSVVLQAGNTQFRVHWGVLAPHSSVFRDMRGRPKPPDEPNVDTPATVATRSLRGRLSSIHYPIIGMIIHYELSK